MTTENRSPEDPITFRELSPTARELQKLIALSGEWAAEESCYGYAANDASSFNGQRIFAAETEDGIVGYLYGHIEEAKNISSIIKDGVPYFEIEELYITPRYRSRGIGKRLFLFVQDDLSREGIGYIKLTTATRDHDAIRRFYVEKAGMTPWSMTLYKKILPQCEKKQTCQVRVIPYDEQYRDDMIFMVLSAKNALGRVPRLNPDLLAVRESYFDKGGFFWLAVDGHDRVVGCVGFNSADNSTEAVLHRLYVKPEMKRQGIGSALLEVAEKYIKSQGKTDVCVHLGEPRETWFESYAFYPKHGYEEYAPRHMRKKL